MKLMLVMILMMNVLFMQASHPVALMVMILAQTLLCCLMLMSLNTTSWFSFILFLIFLGGLMVLFIYISSLASNEKFSIKLNKVPFPLIMLLLTGTLMIYSVNNQTPSFSFTNEVKLLTNMYTTNIMNPTLMTMLYLLLTLIVVVKMTSKYEGPLRNMIYK